jgi:hypothetical protein
MAEANLESLSTVRLQMVTNTISSTGGTAGITHNVLSGNETWILKNLTISNQSANSTDNEMSVQFRPNGGTARYIMYKVWVPWTTALIVIHENIGLYFQYGDEIRVIMEQGSNAEVVFSYQTLRQ